jgi:hypothetical protein
MSVFLYGKESKKILTFQIVVASNTHPQKGSNPHLYHA